MSATRTPPLRRAAPRIVADVRGATTVEFGFVSGFLFLILFAITDLGFAFWQWSSATKALQLGTRLASVSDPVASDLKTLTGLSSAVYEGDPMPQYERVCSGASKTCSGGTFDQTALNTLVYGRGNASCPTATQSFPPMCQIFPRIKPENVVIEYVHTGLGYAGRPGGPIPTIRLRLTDLNYEFITLSSLLGLPAISMSGLTATATAEDLSGK
jgi:hypothetical protein